MVPNNRVTLFLMAMSVIVFCGIPFSAIYVGPSSTWAQGRTTGGGPARGGPGDSGDRGGRGGTGGQGQTPPGMSMPGMLPWGAYAPSDDEITRVLNAIRMRDPSKANELETIRKTTPQFFMDALRPTPEYNNLMATRINILRTSRRSDFIKWLELYVPTVADELNRLRAINDVLYVNRYDLAWQKYSNVFDKSQKNSDPNWSKNLVEDFELEEKQNNLLTQIRDPRIFQNPSRRNELESQLKEVVSKRYDISVQQQHIEYEQLLRQLDDLQSLIQTKLDDLKKRGDPNEKAQIVESRMQYLTRPMMRGIGGGGGRGGGRR